jgi:hypothetical protein
MTIRLLTAFLRVLGLLPARVLGGGAPAAGDRFGAALASGMLVDGRPCTDLLAGAPGRGGTGEAYLLFGSTGASPRATAVLRAPDAAPDHAPGCGSVFALPS